MPAIAFRARYVLTLTVVLCLLSLPLPGATLSSSTIAAWNQAVEQANADAQRRLLPGKSFLWTFEDAKRAARVHRGEIVVSKVGEKMPLAVPGGLIHHWRGVIFIPNARQNDVIDVVRDYDRYKDFYRPSVIDSKLIARIGSEEKFSMMLMNKALFLQTALEAEYQVSSVQVSDRRFYSISKSTRIQEIKNFGDPSEEHIPEGQGSGYIWKLYTAMRFEQRDGGVYAEVEVMALSRDIPAAFRIIAEPIVRNVSHNSLVLSLRQTEQAVHSLMADNIPSPVPSGAAGFLAIH